ncbi:hypothetical protein D6817_03240, partial [Candidatus Pacearchaeota archaeon]
GVAIYRRKVKGAGMLARRETCAPRAPRNESADQMDKVLRGHGMRCHQGCAAKQALLRMKEPARNFAFHALERAL